MRAWILILNLWIMSTPVFAFGVATEYTQILNHIALLKTVSALSEQIHHQLDSIAYLRKQYLDAEINVRQLSPHLLYQSTLDAESARIAWIDHTNQNIEALTALYHKESQLITEELYDMSHAHLDPDAYWHRYQETNQAAERLRSEQAQEESALLAETHQRTHFLTALLHTAPQLKGHEETLALLLRFNELSLQESLEQKALLTQSLSAAENNARHQENHAFGQQKLYALENEQDNQRSTRDASFWAHLIDPILNNHHA